MQRFKVHLSEILFASALQSCLALTLCDNSVIDVNRNEMKSENLASSKNCHFNDVATIDAQKVHNFASGEGHFLTSSKSFIPWEQKGEVLCFFCH